MSEVSRYWVEWRQISVRILHSVGSERRRAGDVAGFKRVQDERDALQERLNAADQRIDVLTDQQAEAIDLLSTSKTNANTQTISSSVSKPQPSINSPLQSQPL